MTVGSDGTIAVGSQLYFTGLLPDPRGRPNVHKAFADSGKMLTREQIAKELANPKRMRARLIFPAAKWIKNQGQHNSCAPYATGSIMEKTAALKGSQYTELAPESTYAQVNGGRDQGAVLRHCIDAAGTYGMAPRTMVKHGVYLKRDIGIEADRNAKRFRLVKEETFNVRSDDELASAVAAGFLVLLAVEVGQPWYRLDGDGVVAPTNGTGNHAIHADDMRINARGVYEYDHAGSWGTSYGQEGRGYITWSNHLRDSVRYHEFIATRVICDDPDAPQLPKAA